ncbi:MAG TPA: UvrD-helicase domain-containing protein [Tepidisphaeraceae bacterium]|nr:UvrD-helicase domain-containing protein [Tepidisphaeraceae bacterium]
MPLSENRVIVACAGSGKTSLLVKDALSNPDRRIAILTYTNNNMREIISRFGEMNSGVPKHVDVATWFTFLLHECARPYQRSKYAEKRIEAIAWVNGRSTRGIPETDTRRYYFASGERVYQDKIAQFIIRCQEVSGNRVTARLQQIYTDVFIDEFQDLAGWDLNIVEMLLRSGMRITLVGDPRQCIYSTNLSAKNAKYRRIGVTALAEEWEEADLCRIEPLSGSHRCNQGICDIANGLWPGMEAMSPMTNDTTEHDGVFLVAKDVAREYIARFDPQVLRYSSIAESYGSAALNFGLSKGLQFNRVLIVPTEPIRKYLKTGNLKHVEASKDKFHVAVTRARHSVAFVYDGPSVIVATRWPSSDA